MFHITKTKSLARPFQVILPDKDNYEPLSSSQRLSSKQKAFQNIAAQIDHLASSGQAQDDTLKTPVVYLVYARGNEKIKTSRHPVPVYQPGKNKKRKTKKQ